MKSLICCLVLVLALTTAHVHSLALRQTGVGSSFPGSRCGPVCYMYCPYGNVLDSRGCPLCRCKPGPRRRVTTCPPVCAIYCPNGNVLDSNGCPTCRCRPGSRRVYVLQDRPEPDTTWA